MACAASQAVLTANTCSLVSPRSFFNNCPNAKRQSLHNSFFRIRAASTDEDVDCNVEECAPDKEVGKVSMEWLAGEKTKVTGTFPPKKRGWTGYVEKDTAGQTNIYSIEPAVYVAESAISSGNAGSSSDGAENTVAIAAGIALISIAAASLILLQVGKNSPPQVQTIDYSGPSLSYYINKFKPPEIIKASVPTQTESSTSVQPESLAPEVRQIEIESGNQQEPSTSSQISSS